MVAGFDAEVENMKQNDRESVNRVLRGVETRLRRISRKRNRAQSKAAYKLAAQQVHKLVRAA